MLIDPAMQWLAEPAGKRGRPAAFPDAAIQLCLSVKVLFRLPLRQAAGMVGALLKLAGLLYPAPRYRTLCRRQKTLAVQIPCRRAGGPLKLLVDTSSSATANGTPASTASRADVNAARSIWPWRQPHPTSGPSGSPPAKVVSFGALDLPEEQGAGRAASFAADGKAVDPVALAAHHKALEYLRTHPGTEYLDAIRAVS